MLLLNTTSRNELFCYLFYTPYKFQQILFMFKFLGVKSGRQESNLLPSRLQTACPYNQQTPTRYKNLSKPLLSIFLPVLFIRSIFGALINKITLKIYRNIETLRKFIKLYFYRVSYQPHLLPELLKLIS